MRNAHSAHGALYLLRFLGGTIVISAIIPRPLVRGRPVRAAAVRFLVVVRLVITVGFAVGSVTVRRLVMLVSVFRWTVDKIISC